MNPRYAALLSVVALAVPLVGCGPSVSVQAASVSAASSPFYRATFGVFGDSYSSGNQWQPGVAAYHGMTQTFQDAYPGRGVQSIFHCYGDVASPSAINDGSCGAYNNGVRGHTLAQDLSNVKLLIIVLGVNDFFLPVGSTGDNVSSATFHGYIKRALSTLEATNPTMRIVWVTPVQVGVAERATTVPGLRQAIMDECALFSVPVVDEFARSGINSANWSIFLDADLLHLNTRGFSSAYIPTMNLALSQTNPLD